jgi:hypothetical protein
VQLRLTDFHESCGIKGWTLEDHINAHERDLAWLNGTVRDIQEREPYRQIIILTHHSPTMDPRANDPVHKVSTIKSGFVTDLSAEPCWTSPLVKMWAFGHTHYSFQYHDNTGKLVIANQKGYSGIGSRGPSSTVKAKVVEARGNRWETISIEDHLTQKGGSKALHLISSNPSRLEEAGKAPPKNKTSFLSPSKLLGKFLQRRR